MNKKLLNNILVFLQDTSGTGQYTAHQLASELSIYIIEQDVLSQDIKKVLKTLKTDAKWAIKGKWDPCGEGMEGFANQIELIDRVLPQLKKIKL